MYPFDVGVFASLALVAHMDDNGSERATRAVQMETNEILSRALTA